MGKKVEGLCRDTLEIFFIILPDLEKCGKVNLIFAKGPDFDQVVTNCWT